MVTIVTRDYPQLEAIQTFFVKVFSFIGFVVMMFVLVGVLVIYFILIGVVTGVVLGTIVGFMSESF